VSARESQTEATPLGEQMLVPGIAPVTTRQRIEARMSSPLMPRKPQKPLDIGLFDDMARNQLNLF
jgi:hypothetical protein